jgi:Fe-S-cluster-containing hydrogenase component 2
MFVLPRQNCIHCSTSSLVVCPLGHIRNENYSFDSRSDTWSRKTNWGLTECIEWDDEEFLRVTGNKINNTIV